MITTVAPTAMMAMKLASVAVWISVYELKKLLTVAPVDSSTCDPAAMASATISVAMMRTRPACCERSSRRRTIMARGIVLRASWISRIEWTRSSEREPKRAASRRGGGLFDHHQQVTGLDSLAGAGDDLPHGPADGRLDLRLQLHRLGDEQLLSGLH